MTNREWLEKVRPVYESGGMTPQRARFYEEVRDAEDLRERIREAYWEWQTNPSGSISEAARIKFYELRKQLV